MCIVNFKCLICKNKVIGGTVISILMLIAHFHRLITLYVVAKSVFDIQNKQFVGKTFDNVCM